jgi:hypothetical protein
VYGFAKNRRANIDEAAKHVLALTEKQLAGLVRRGDFVEVESQ